MTVRPSRRPPDHPLLKRLYAPLQQDVQREVQLALKVALLASEGYTRKEIEQLTGAQPAQLRTAWARLERVAPAIDRDSPFDVGGF